MKEVFVDASLRESVAHIGLHTQVTEKSYLTGIQKSSEAEALAICYAILGGANVVYSDCKSVVQAFNRSKVIWKTRDHPAIQKAHKATQAPKLPKLKGVAKLRKKHGPVMTRIEYLLNKELTKKEILNIVDLEYPLTRSIIGQLIFHVTEELKLDPKITQTELEFIFE